MNLSYIVWFVTNRTLKRFINLGRGRRFLLKLNDKVNVQIARELYCKLHFDVCNLRRCFYRTQPKGVLIYTIVLFRFILLILLCIDAKLEPFCVISKVSLGEKGMICIHNGED